MNDSIQRTAANDLKDPRMLQSILSNTGDAILVTEAEPIDLPGPTVVYVNESFTKMTGYIPEDIIGKSPRILQGAGSDRGSLDRIRSALESWSSVREELLNYRKDGSEFWVELDIVPVANARGYFTHWVSVQRDITKRKKTQDRLQASLTENSSDVVSVFEPSGELRFMSESATRILGYPSEDFTLPDLRDYIHPEDRKKVVREFFSHGAKSFTTSLVEFRVRDASGSWRTFEALANNLVEDPAVGGVIVNAWDITERRESEKTLRLRDGAIAASSNGILITDCLSPDNPVIYFNPALERITGYASHEVLGRNARFLQGSDVNQPGLDGLRQAVIKGHAWNGILRNYKKNGDLFWNEMSVSPVFDAEDRLVNFIGIQNDVTDRKVLEERLEHQAFHDSLTNLPNRALLLDRLDQALVRAKRHDTLVAILFMDLDNFKFVNDSLGHSTGDRLLVEVSRKIRDSLREGDTIARLGGDEFVVLLEDLKTQDEARAMANRISESFAEPFILASDRKYRVTASIGIAFGRGVHSERPEKLLGDADLAMYRAKEDGKDRFSVFTPSMSERALERLNLEQELREAISNEELRLHYQPQFSVETGEVVAVEALIRWERPGRGLVYPAEFITVAEENGLIGEIGLWAMKEACRQTVEWNEYRVLRGKPGLEVGVNISANQFGDPGLANDVLAVLSESGLSAEYLVLEITESTLMSNASSTMSALGTLKKSGIKLAVDDFGTGYSSLSYLKRFPVDYLKVDRSFIEDEAILQVAIFLANSMGLEVIAEGVEKAEQLEHLRDLRCGTAQGYYLQRPVPAPRISPHL